MAKAKSGKSSKARVSRSPKEVPPLAPIEPQSSPDKSSPGNSIKWRLIAVVALVLFVIYQTHKSSSPSPGAAPAASTELQPSKAWGPELKLEVADKFSSPDGVMDIKVDAQGDVYTLNCCAINEYVNGKLTKTYGLNNGPNRSMAFSGDIFYITDSDNNVVSMFDKALNYKGDFSVSGSERLLGIAWNPKSAQLVATEVYGSKLYFLGPEGKRYGQWNGPLPKAAPADFAYDLQFDDSGNLYENDVYSGKISIVAPDKKIKKPLPLLCGAGENQRVVILDGKLYTNCSAEGVIFVRDLEGRAIGYVRQEQPQMMVAGLDGFLYLQTEGKMMKMKPVVASVPSDSVALSPTAK